MNLFEIDFLAKMSTLLKEAFQFKKYKAMPAALSVFVGILMIPFVLLSFVGAAAFAALAFAFRVISAPVRYLHAMVHGEGKSVMHGTQVIIYLISWPMIFFFYLLMSFLLVMLLPMYAFTALCCYVWTLGGFRFHLFLDKYEDISIEVNGKYALALPLVYVILGTLIVLWIPIVHGAVYYMELWNDYLEQYFVLGFATLIYPMYIGIHSVFTLLYALIGLARFPKEHAPVQEAEIETLCEDVPVPEALTFTEEPVEESVEEIAEV